MTTKLTIRWNKDMSISLYSRGKLIQKYDGAYARDGVEAFLNGWFQGGERNVRWIYA
jgi:hypothetical protein